MSALFEDKGGYAHGLRGSQGTVREDESAAPLPVSDAQGQAETPSEERDYEAALGLVEHAFGSLRAAQSRIAELEEELRQSLEISASHREEMKALHGRFQSLQGQVHAAEHRAQLAEKRAADAEEWLARLHDAIKAGFAPT